MASTDRDDANLTQFRARAKQPKVLAAGPGALKNGKVPSPVNLTIVFDTGFGGDSCDDNRLYVGTSPLITPYESMCSRRVTQECMKSGFQW